MDPAIFYGGHIAAQVFDLVQFGQNASFHLVGESFHVKGSAQRVRHLGNTGLLLQDLLGAQGKQGGLLGGHRIGLVKGVHMQGLHPSQHRGQGMIAGPHHVVQWFLAG